MVLVWILIVDLKLCFCLLIDFMMEVGDLIFSLELGTNSLDDIGLNMFDKRLLYARA